ncbi:AAA family ATPase [Geomesophilobacter sediminis]|uniref:ATP-binding protein n=1 Tax=Geomesophilobacter sediminis TaxID=2798584 RepID=A0A8J7IZ72_9BACT|nr:ATP-binding protein [Geomesophilobacter sediminis]MBJ6725447.1 ATP-binding protein [Geomesophilobacter sediminis]
MPSAKLLRQLIKSGSEGNFDAFKTATEQVIQEERAKQHHLLANDLERLLYGRASNSNTIPRSVLDKVPEDKERGLALLHVKEPAKNLEDIVLSDENRSLLDEILQEHHRRELLTSYGLYPADKILFCGPPGCGKTLSAEIVASELGLPLAIVRLDSVVSSYLGETAANLRKVFDFISRTPMVVLFDEFDALAKERADMAEHGELKRVVNAVLQMLDSYDGRSLLIAATNHEGIMDSAIWRRFDEVLVFNPPNLEQIRRLLEIKLRGVRRDFDIDQRNLAGMFKGFSYADIERVLRRAIKDMIVSGKEFLAIRHIEAALRREDARTSRLKRI